ncbi:hypothetical protein [Burkholderia ubonensis]|uniref:hypothetical protein n=1 Tax=Burkholderia ubonensis TaxID=101571 RepID=UPI000ABCCE2E|nr:hypothetical protein [Burkholderia ubonensis]
MLAVQCFAATADVEVSHLSQKAEVEREFRQSKFSTPSFTEITLWTLIFSNVYLQIINHHLQNQIANLAPIVFK